MNLAWEVDSGSLPVGGVDVCAEFNGEGEAGSVSERQACVRGEEDRSRLPSGRTTREAVILGQGDLA